MGKHIPNVGLAKMMLARHITGGISVSAISAARNSKTYHEIRKKEKLVGPISYGDHQLLRREEISE